MMIGRDLMGLLVFLADTNIFFHDAGGVTLVKLKLNVEDSLLRAKALDLL